MIPKVPNLQVFFSNGCSHTFSNNTTNAFCSVKLSQTSEENIFHWTCLASWYIVSSRVTQGSGCPRLVSIFFTLSIMLETTCISVGSTGMDQQFPTVVGEVTFKNKIFWYPVLLGTLWIWLIWKFSFPTVRARTQSLFKAAICRRSSGISSVNSWLQQISKRRVGKGGLSTASNSCSEISGTDSVQGHFGDDVECLQTFTLFPKPPCWYKTVFVMCFKSVFGHNLNYQQKPV